MRRFQLGEWPLVAGIVLSIGLFLLAEPLNAEGGDTTVVMRPSTEDAHDSAAGVIGQAHVDVVDEDFMTTQWGDHEFAFSGSSHVPRAGDKWGVTAVVTKNGKPLKAEVRTDVLINSAVVRHVGITRIKNGSYTESWVWPSQAAGADLTVRVTIDADDISQTFLYAVKVVGRN